MTLSALAFKLGVSDRQLRKYERGAVRLSTIILLQAAQLFDLPLSYFLEGLFATHRSDEKPNVVLLRGPLPEEVELVWHFRTIEDRIVRKYIVEMTRAMSRRQGRRQKRVRNDREQITAGELKDSGEMPS